MEKKLYTCPMHPAVRQDKPGRCPKCGMSLVPQSHLETSAQKDMHHEMSEKGLGKITLKNYIPLFVITGLILVSSFTVTLPNPNIKDLISNFMIGFFLVFSGFKLIDLKGFAQGYYTYDLLAKRWFSYGYIYPFIELGFGLLMISKIYESQVLIAEIIVMGFSGLGVLLKLIKHERFQCVCLGTFLKVPLTYVTLIEDFGMVLLALFLLLSK